MGGVHIRLDLEDEAGELLFMGIDLAGEGLPGTRRRGQFYEGIEHFTDAEVVDGAAEEDRGLIPLQIFFQFKGVGRPRQKLEIPPQLIRLTPQKLVEPGIVQIPDNDPLGNALFPRGEEMKLLAKEIVGPLEALSHADGPGEGRALDLQSLLDVRENVQRLEPFAVKFVDEGQDGSIAHAADFHQLAGLGLDPLGAVDHHHGTVHRRQDPVGVFGEVLVTGGVEEIHLVIAVVELHDR